MAVTASSATLLDTFTSRREGQPALALRVMSVLFFTALTAAAAQISVPLPFTAVPFTFQPMIVLLAGLTLGSRLALASQVLYLAAGIAGLPVFAASATLLPGALRLLGPTGGYLMSYPFAAFAVGYLAEHGLGRRYVTSVAALFGGMTIVYACGALWLAYFAQGGGRPGLATAFAAGVAPFVLADVLKLFAGAAIVPSLWRFFGRGTR